MIVDPKHQRSPSVSIKKSLFKIRGARLSNPFKYEEQIFKCAMCQDHFYMTENKGDGVCKTCRQKLRTKDVGNQVETKSVDKGLGISGHDLGNGFDPYTGDSGDESDHLQK